MKTILKTVLVGALIVLGGCGGSNADSGYTSAERDVFVNSCSTTGDYSTCVCTFNYLTNNLPYDDYLRIDNEIKNGAAASDYSVLVDAFNSCT